MTVNGPVCSAPSALSIVAGSDDSAQRTDAGDPVRSGVKRRRFSESTSGVLELSRPAHRSQARHAASQRLRENAARMGPKAAMVIELSQLLGVLGITHMFSVPPMLVLDHAVLPELLRARGYDAEGAWQTFLSKRKPQASDLSDTEHQALKTLGLQVKEALAGAHHQAVADWCAAHPDARFEVRSTGVEDSIEPDGTGVTFANPGGNDTVDNVEPTAPKVMEAVGQVASSYVAARSILQRLRAGDDLQRPLFLPVFIQVMIGEVLGGEIPVSGVLYTQEPEGPTPGVAQVHAAYGHNKGVVESLVNCDTFYVDRDFRIQALIRAKEQRLVPGENGLTLHDNPAALQHVPCLKDVTLCRLHRFGQVMQERSGWPMRIEWTYFRGTIWLFQATRLDVNRHSMPCHLDAGLVAATKQKVVGTTIGAAGGAVQFLESPTQLIIASSLEAARKNFLSRRSPEQTRAVVIERMAEASSHDAEMFRQARVPVVYLPSSAALHAMHKKGVPLLLDSTAAVLLDARALLQTKPKEADLLTHLRSTRQIRQGWLKHPLPACATFGAMPRVQKTALLPALLSLPTTARMPLAVRGHTITSLLAEVASECVKTRHLALAAILRQAYRLTRLLKKHTALAERATALQASVANTVQALLCEADNSESMSFLYHLNWLRAAFLQTPDAEVMHTDSYVSLLAEMTEIRRLPKEYQATVAVTSDAMLAYARFGKLALRPEVANAWHAFVGSVMRDADPSLHKRLLQLINRVSKLGIAEVWLPCAFMKSPHMRPVEFLLMTLERQLDYCQDTILWTLHVRSQLRTWRSRIAEWSEPNAFEALWHDLEPQVVFNQVLTRYTKANELGKLIVSTCLGECVETYDELLKALIGSPTYSSRVSQAKRYAEMLGPLHDLAHELVPAFRDGDWFYDADLKESRQNGNWLRAMERDEQTAIVQLRPSAHFAPAATLIRHGNYVIPPLTLCDLHTHYHQNLLAMVAAANARHGVCARALPGALENLVTRLTSARYHDCNSLEVTGIRYSYPELSVDLNLTLRQHGVRLRLIGNVKDLAAIKMEVRMDGPTEIKRDERVRMYAALLARALEIDFLPDGRPKFESLSVQFAWQVPLLGEAGASFCRTIAPILKLMVATTYYHETWQEMLDGLRKILPSIDAMVDSLDEAFLQEFPWQTRSMVYSTERPDRFFFIWTLLNKSPPETWWVSDTIREMRDRCATPSFQAWWKSASNDLHDNLLKQLESLDITWQGRERDCMVRELSAISPPDFAAKLADWRLRDELRVQEAERLQ